MPKNLISSVLIDLRDFAERIGLVELALDLEKVRLRHLSHDPQQPPGVQRHQIGDNVVMELTRAQPSRHGPSNGRANDPPVKKLSRSGQRG